MTARERIDALVDAGSFEEFGLFAQHRQQHFGMAGKEVPADGVVTGAGAIAGGSSTWPARTSPCSAARPARSTRKVAEVMEQALHTGSPFIFINDSGGARVQEGIDSLSGYGRSSTPTPLLSGAVPQISIICGPCAGGAAYSPALTDFIIQTRSRRCSSPGRR
jgi:methylmalonyl-CoA carboxyltransferase 12S subunit